jgi:hypothetical protein
MHAGAAETPGDGRGLDEAYAILPERSTGESEWLFGGDSSGRKTPHRGGPRECALDAIVRTTRSMLRSYGTHL